MNLLASLSVVERPHRMLDTTKAFKEFGFKAQTGFREGLSKTIEWYRNSAVQQETQLGSDHANPLVFKK